MIQVNSVSKDASPAQSVAVMKTLLSLFVFLFTATAPLSAELLKAVTVASFAGTSTLHDFEGKASSQPADAEWADGALSLPSVTFDVTGLNTDHAKRDKNMMKMFEPAKHPAIVGSINAWKLVPGQVSEQQLEINIHGSSVTVPVKVTRFEVGATETILECEFTLSLKACTLQRPSVMGIIRVGDEVKLHTTTTLKRL